ncbi:MAG TPA: hypothetical protein VLU23_09935, partial [Pseudolabrys sp.]|nr:hypothetical protein [Pseudolabrys sp.]
MKILGVALQADGEYGVTVVTGPKHQKEKPLNSTGRRNTSISFFLLGFESQGVAHIACDPKVPGFSAAAKSSKNPRRIG